MVAALLLRDGTMAAVRLPPAVAQGAAAPGSGLKLTAAPVEVTGLADLPSCVGQSLVYLPAADVFVASLRRVAGEGHGWLISGRPVSDERLLANVTLTGQPTVEVRVILLSLPTYNNAELPCVLETWVLARGAKLRNRKSATHAPCTCLRLDAPVHCPLGTTGQ